MEKLTYRSDHSFSCKFDEMEMFSLFIYSASCVLNNSRLEAPNYTHIMLEEANRVLSQKSLKVFKDASELVVEIRRETY